MANHGFVTTDKKMSVESLGQFLHDLNENRFRGLMEIENVDAFHDDPPGWDISGPGLDVPLHMWLNDPRSFEIRHTGGDFAWYVDITISNTIACQFGGWISDDGVGERWRGDPNKYKTFRDWLKGSWHGKLGYRLALMGADKRVRDL